MPMEMEIGSWSWKSIRVRGMSKTNRLTIAVAQLKFRAAIGDNVSCITEVIHSSGRAGADVVLFPECSVTGYNCDFAAVSPSEIGAALQAIAAQARAAHCYVLVGSPTFTARTRFNSLVVFDPRGREVFRYSKIHLTARDRRFFTRETRWHFSASLGWLAPPSSAMNDAIRS